MNLQFLIIVGLIVAVLLVVTGTCTLRASGQELGDVNNDAIVNSVDALNILQLDAGLIDLKDGYFGNADVNTDGRINPVDAQLILQLDAGVISNF